MIWEIWMKCEMIWTIWKKDELNNEINWKRYKKNKSNSEKYGKYGRKVFSFYKTINTACNLFKFTLCPTVRGE